MEIAIIRADVSHAGIISALGKKAFRQAFEHLFVGDDELTEYLESTYDPSKLSKSLRKENNLYFISRWMHPAGLY